jgi:hypothetical protein
MRYIPEMRGIDIGLSGVFHQKILIVDVDSIMSTTSMEYDSVG